MMLTSNLEQGVNIVTKNIVTLKMLLINGNLKPFFVLKLGTCFRNLNKKKGNLAGRNANFSGYLGKLALILCIY